MASIERSGALDRHDAALDGLVAEAADVMRMPVAALTVVLRDRQEMLAVAGMRRVSVPRDASFCTHVVAAGEVVVMRDSHRDPFFANHPHVAGGLRIRSYCGAPIRTPDNEVAGTLCVLGEAPRSFTRAELEAFVAIAQSARRVLFPGAPPVRIRLAPDASTSSIDPLATWIERSLPPLVAND